MPAFLEIDGVVAGYGGGDILRGVDLAVDEGTLTCLVGPNGAGKSTVLKVVSGLLAPKRGTVRFKGLPIGGRPPRAIVDLGIVQVAQDRSLFPAMTVRENVMLGAFSLRDHALKAKRLATIMERFPVVAERARDRAGSLSGGQQKLVEFARALMLEPTVMLVDEPSMGLEPKARRIVFDTLKQLRAEGRTILLVEQNARSGLEIADRGVVLERGRVRLTGSGAEILVDEHVGDIYMGKSVRLAAQREGQAAGGSAGTSSPVPGDPDKGDAGMSARQRRGAAQRSAP